MVIVLILQDGNRVGGLGFESGDHAEPVDVLTVERVEIVKGPATLLYGSNAIGGIVNTVSGHDSPHKGFNSYFTGLGGTNGPSGGGSGGFEFGTDKWLFWGMPTGNNPATTALPSAKCVTRFREKSARKQALVTTQTRVFSVSTTTSTRDVTAFRLRNPNDPEAEIVELNPRRHSIEFRGGFRNSGTFIDAGTFSLQYNNYKHAEVDKITGETGTAFKNNTFLYQGLFNQRKTGRLSGRFGFWGQHRDFSATGEEALAPPTKQNSFAVFGLETLDYERVSLHRRQARKQSL